MTIALVARMVQDGQCLSNTKHDKDLLPARKMRMCAPTVPTSFVCLSHLSRSDLLDSLDHFVPSIEMYADVIQ